MKPRDLVLAMVAGLGATQAQAQAFPDAAATDPITLGWMQGSPPPADKVIKLSDGSAAAFPQSRWSLSHQRELFPTISVSRGTMPVAPLERRERSDIDAVSFTPIGASTPMTWAASLAANYTDGILVLHKGRIVYERYIGALEPGGQHIAFSVTKSFIGTLAATLIADGTLDPAARVDSYIPELAGSGFADATLRQILDMTTSLKYSEVYADPESDVYDYRRAAGRYPLPSGYAGPTTVYDYLKTIPKDGEHGKAFTYKTPNTEVLGWIIARVTGKSLADNLKERIWSKLGMERDGYFSVDTIGTPSAGGGLNLTLRDMARFGEMMRNGGQFAGQQVVPAAVVAKIAGGASRDDFAKAGYKTLPGWSYRDQWWVSHNAHGAFMARGIYGQAIYIDPKAEMVIARFASHHIAGNAGIDPNSLPAYEAIAKHLMGE